MSQRDVWESIAAPWNEYRTTPGSEAAAFLKERKGFVLDVGCGSGRNFLRGRYKVVGIDFSLNMLQLAQQTGKKKGISFFGVLSDASVLPFANDAFDAALSVAMLHCLRKRARRKSLEELHRVLKPGAEALITVWNREQPRFHGKREGMVPWTYKGKTYERYYHLYDGGELASELAGAGFAVTRLSGSEEKAFNIFPRNIIAVVRKE